MRRRAFIRRMVFAGLATWFLDLPLPRETVAAVKRETDFALSPNPYRRTQVYFRGTEGWGGLIETEGSIVYYGDDPMGKPFMVGESYTVQWGDDGPHSVTCVGIDTEYHPADWRPSA